MGDRKDGVEIKGGNVLRVKCDLLCESIAS